MEKEKINRGLFEFLDSSPCALYAVENTAKKLDGAGFRRLYESGEWELKPGGSYYVTRGGTAICAFRLPEGSRPRGYNITASHSDSPTFRVKNDPELVASDGLVRINIEKYGGMILSTWFDRPLSVAGRVVVRTPEGAESRLVCVDRDLMLIPSLAIHMDRQANDGRAFNVQDDMPPLFASGCGRGELTRAVADAAGVAADDILASDLYLYVREKASAFGAKGEFIASARLDDLECAYSSLEALLAARPKESAAVHCVFDNEEVGSGTRQGAASDFLAVTLRRVTRALGGSEEDHLRALASSFMVSADNAHAVHPAHAGKADPVNRPVLNGGVVIKYSANQKYTTDAVSGAIFRAVCERAGVPVQVFHNRSDMIGGSTLGNISSAQLPVNTVDIGLPQLAMHSAYETAGADDPAMLVRVLTEFYSLDIKADGDGKYAIG